jgi:uncharacterized short protein YbdD (DUF466 family)
MPWKLTTRQPFVNALRGAWSWLRQVTGDAAYENYLRHASQRAQTGAPGGARNAALRGAPAAGTPPLSRAEFYLDSLRRRYSTVSRCC